MAQPPLPEPAEGREGAQQRHEIERERARRRQAAAGLDPRAHLRGVKTEGDGSIWRDWLQIERQHRKGTPLDARIASHMACLDMIDIAHAAWEQEYQRRKAAQP